MGYFDDVDVDDVADDPNNLPNDTYLFQVTKAELKPTRDGSKTGVTFRHQIVEGPWKTFYPLTDWIQVPDENTKREDIPRILSHMKMRLSAFGFTMDEIKTFSEDDWKSCVNRKFYGTTSCKVNPKTKETAIRIQKFDPVGDGVDTMVDFGNSPGIDF